MKPIGIIDPKCAHDWKVYMIKPAGEGKGITKSQKIRWQECSKCGSTQKTITRPDQDLLKGDV